MTDLNPGNPIAAAPPPPPASTGGRPSRNGRAASAWSPPIPLLALVVLVGAAVAGALLADRLLPGREPSSPAAASPHVAAATVAPSSEPATGTPGGSSAGPSASPVAAPSGSPVPAPRPSARPALPVEPAWSLPDGATLELECEEGAGDCLVHRYDAARREEDGWPVTVLGECEHVVAGPGATAFVACGLGRRMQVAGLDASGHLLPGWPVTVAGPGWNGWNGFDYGSLPNVVVGTDGTVYTASERRGAYRVHAFSAAGRERPGWPVRLPGGFQGFRPAAGGALLAWWYEGIRETIDLQARRTVFTLLGPDGRPMDGWPIGSRGAASGPVTLDDGSMAYVSATGRAYRHDVAGRVVEGWPSTVGTVAPMLRSDGMLLFVGAQAVRVLDQAGRTLPGWPRTAAGTFSAATCDTPGWDRPLLAVGADDTLYLLDRGRRVDRILALDRDGGALGGWPYRLAEGWAATGISVGIDGSVQLAIAGGPCATIDATSILIAPGGLPVGPAPGTPMESVYDALRVADLEPVDGRTTLDPGTEVELGFGLVNASGRSITLPRLTGEDGPFYSVGALQTWLQRIDGASLDACLPDAARRGRWYATGGWRNDLGGPVTIGPGDAVPLLFGAALDARLTACLPPGEYRFRVDYGRVFTEDWDDPIDHAAVDLDIPAEGG